jgi:hypothetical protein
MTPQSVSLASRGLLHLVEWRSHEPGPVSMKVLLLLQPLVKGLVLLIRHSLDAIMSIASSKEGMSS